MHDNEKTFKIYKINENLSPRALLVDPNGKIIKRFGNIKYSNVFLQELQFYTTSTKKNANGFEKLKTIDTKKRKDTLDLLHSDY